MKLEIGIDEYSVPEGHTVKRVWLKGRMKGKDLQLRYVNPDELLEKREQWPHMRGTPEYYSVLDNLILIFPTPNAENEIEGEFEEIKLKPGELKPPSHQPVKVKE